MIRNPTRRLLTAYAVAIPLLTAVEGWAGDAVDFNRDVRPILSDRCFKCHGFDEKARQARLRLDVPEGIFQVREGRTIVDPRHPERSELVRRITARDPSSRMPPPDSGLELTAAERDTLIRWVREGAPFEEHWAFVPPPERPLPAVSRADLVRTEVDLFVERELERRGLSLGEQADPETLLRRVTLDLTGLPPAPDDIDRFLSRVRSAGLDPAYEEEVERLLDSPRFGERMALLWLDAARYADTNGFHHDNVRTAWPYRDWVIEAFAEDKPFDEFVIEQLAGDLLPRPNVDQLVATAFCRMHNINDEGGALDEEYRVEAVCDRIETVATVFLGLTFTCARCHDHKYDPFTQEDYYSLYAYFNSVDERGVYPNDFEQARAYPARLMFEPEGLGEKLAAARARVAEAEAALSAAEPGIDAERVEWEREFRETRGVARAEARVEAATCSAGDLVALGDGSYRVPATADTDVLRFSLVTDEADLRMLVIEALADESHPNESVGLASNGNAVIREVRAFAVSAADPSIRRPIEWAWAFSDHEQQNGDYDVHNLVTGEGDGWALDGHRRSDSRTAILVAEEPFSLPGGTCVEVEIACDSRFARHVIGRPRVSLLRARDPRLEDFPLAASDWWTCGPFPAESFDLAYDRAFGPEAAVSIELGARFEGQGWKHAPDVKDGAVAALSGERRAFYLARELRSPVPRRLTASLGSDDAIRVFLNGEELLANKVLRGAAPDQERLEFDVPAGKNLLVVKITNNGGPAGFYYQTLPESDLPASLLPVAYLDPSLRDPDLDRRYRGEWSRRVSPTWRELEGALERARAELAALEDERIPVLVMKELDAPRETFVLTRGNYASPDRSRPVRRRPPLLFGGKLPPGEPDNRLGFARWLVQPDHPLTFRVHVNRIWQMLFGKGIVATSENFGQQADWPSHRELLDHLALDFARTGMSNKRLLRQLVLSQTYRQSSRVTAAAAALDPANRYLSRFPRRRLEGEFIRDQALFAAGVLSERIGGPSVRPYQPPGLWREVSIGGSSNTQVFARDSGEALYRRSLYTFWKRTSPNPQMTTFDAPTREFCVVRRNTTNTPLQALVLWNDEQFVEAARLLAARTLSEEGDRRARLARMFRRVTSRTPDAGDLAILESALADFERRYEADSEAATALLSVGEAEAPPDLDAAELAAWTMVASAMMSLDEAQVRG